MGSSSAQHYGSAFASVASAELCLALVEMSIQVWDDTSGVGRDNTACTGTDHMEQLIYILLKSRARTTWQPRPPSQLHLLKLLAYVVG